MTRNEGQEKSPSRRALTSAADNRRTPAPATPTGRAVSRFNAVRHGILARNLLLTDGPNPESPKQLQRLHAQLRAELAPVGIAEELLVERILAAYWRLRRVLIAEGGLLDARSLADAGAPPEERHYERQLDELRAEYSVAAALLLNGDDLDRIIRYETTLLRQLDRALHDLLALQRARLAAARDAAPQPAPAPAPALTPLAIHVARLELDVRPGRSEAPDTEVAE
ncbi:MAG: hypothetical protein M3Q65_03185 [Chloroflexota bacterium]|nr:hypothetical protein [Chloroflexota bacterium]